MPPIFFDADSSQHSALLDVSQGKNLVIEGPPGTGKSQTISNLIVLALFKGKTVLFVSEKLAALEVVRRRLDQAGMGDFCLELHSHKTKKDRILQDINQRLQNQFSYEAVNNLQNKIDIFTNQKDELVKYAKLINQPFGLCNQSIYDIIWAKEALVTKWPFLNDLDEEFKIINASSLTPADRDNQKTNVELFAEHLTILLSQFPQLSAHPWRGIRKIDVQEKEIFKIITELKQGLNEVLQDTEKFFQKTGKNLSTSFCSLKNLSQTDLPQPSGIELCDKLSKLKIPEARFEVKTFIEDLSLWEATREILNNNIRNSSALENQKSKERVRQPINQLLAQGFGSWNIKDLFALEKSVTDLLRFLQEVSEIIALVIKDLSQSFSITLGSLDPLFVFLDHLLKSKPDFKNFGLRDPIIWETKYIETQKRADEEAKSILALQDSLGTKFFLTRLPSSSELRHHAQTISSSSLLDRWFSSRYRKVKSYYRSLHKEGVPDNPSVMVANLNILADYQDALTKFRDNSQFSEAFGPLFRWLQTPFDDIANLQKQFQDFKKDINPYLTNCQPFILAMEVLPVEILSLIDKQASRNPSFLHELSVFPTKLETFWDQINLREDMQLEEGVELVTSISILLKEAVFAISSFSFNEQLTIGEIPALLTLSEDFLLEREKLDNNVNISSLLGPSYKGTRSDLEELHATLNLIENIFNLNLTENIQDWLLTSECLERLAFFRSFLEILHQRIFHYHDYWSSFETLTEVDFAQWYGLQSNSWEQLALQDIISRFEQALKGASAFSGWMEYLRSRQPLLDAQLVFIIEQAERGILKPSQLEVAYEFAIFNGLTTLIFEQFPKLREFYGVRHEKIRKQFQELDKEIIHLNRKQAGHRISQRNIPPGNKVGRIRDYTDLALIRHEISKQRGHIAIRKLIDRSHNALLGLKPCFMMDRCLWHNIWAQEIFTLIYWLWMRLRSLNPKRQLAQSPEALS